MITIRLYIKEHQRQERLFAAFEYNKKINTIIKRVCGAKWSNMHRQWHFPLTKESVQQIRQQAKGLAIVDLAELRQQLVRRKQLKSKTHFADTETTEKPLQAFILPAAELCTSQNSKAALSGIGVVNRGSDGEVFADVAIKGV